MSTNNSSSGNEPAINLDVHRLAVTFTEAIHGGDEQQIQAVLDVIAGPELPGFLMAMVGQVLHAVDFETRGDVPAFLEAHRAVLSEAAGAGDE